LFFRKSKIPLRAITGIHTCVYIYISILKYHFFFRNRTAYGQRGYKRLCSVGPKLMDALRTEDRTGLWTLYARRRRRRHYYYYNACTARIAPVLRIHDARARSFGRVNDSYASVVLFLLTGLFFFFFARAYVRPINI